MAIRVQRVIATLGRMDELREDGSLDALLRRGSKFCETMMVISSHQRGESVEVGSRRIGPGLIFERLWQETGCREVIEKLLSSRRFDFPVERAIFLTVLHRLFDPGSDRQADRWREEYRIEGVNELQLHIYPVIRGERVSLSCPQPCEEVPSEIQPSSATCI